MSGWTFAGWFAAVVVFYAMVWRSQRNQEELAKVKEENAVLWDQVQRFDNAWSEQRARQAVTN